jgi:hypothetical protein
MSAMPQPARAARPIPPRGPALRLLTAGALLNVLVISGVTVTILSVWVLAGLDGWRYYGTPLSVRGYDAMHRVLRPSGVVGQTLGLVGLLLMLVPFVYLVRKRLARRGRGGTNLKLWLEIHIFCGIVGPVAVTYHTAFKFNGLVAVAYWSMVLVALSGFVGRYLYVRMPRTIRGIEVSDAELRSRLDELKEDLQWRVPPGVLDELEAAERALLASPATMTGLLLGGWRPHHAGRAAGDRLRAAGVAEDVARDVTGVIVEREQVLRRLHYARRTKELFDLWHVLHLPLVWVMLAIVALHVGVALYLGYVPFRW